MFFPRDSFSCPSESLTPSLGESRSTAELTVTRGRPAGLPVGLSLIKASADSQLRLGFSADLSANIKNPRKSAGRTIWRTLSDLPTGLRAQSNQSLSFRKLVEYERLNSSQWILGHDIAPQLATHLQTVAWLDFSVMPSAHSRSDYNQTRPALWMHACVSRNDCRGQDTSTHTQAPQQASTSISDSGLHSQQYAPLLRASLQANQSCKTPFRFRGSCSCRQICIWWN